MIKEFIKNLGKNKRERKEKFKELDEDIRMQKLIEERQKSANERELNRYINEDREKKIKQQLEFVRKKRNNEINYGYNSLDTPNITNHSDFNILKQKNLFSHNGNMFANQKRIY
jgi:hypothetical protein